MFNIGDRVMIDEDQAILCSKWLDAGSRTLGGKKRDRLERITDQLEQQWPGP